MKFRQFSSKISLLIILLIGSLTILQPSSLFNNPNQGKISYKISENPFTPFVGLRVTYINQSYNNQTGIVIGENETHYDTIFEIDGVTFPLTHSVSKNLWSSFTYSWYVGNIDQGGWPGWINVTNLQLNDTITLGGYLEYRIQDKQNISLGPNGISGTYEVWISYNSISGVEYWYHTDNGILLAWNDTIKGDFWVVNYTNTDLNPSTTTTTALPPTTTTPTTTEPPTTTPPPTTTTPTTTVPPTTTPPPTTTTPTTTPPPTTTTPTTTVPSSTTPPPSTTTTTTTTHSTTTNTTTSQSTKTSEQSDDSTTTTDDSTNSPLTLTTPYSPLILLIFSITTIVYVIKKR